jgi:hypothetical protein
MKPLKPPRSINKHQTSVEKTSAKPTGDANLTNYWIFKVKDEMGGLYGRRGYVIFEHRTKEGFWAIRECSEKGKPEANIELLEKGDHAVFYLVGKGGSRFLGTCILDSGYTRLNAEQTKRIVHNEYIDSDQGVFIKEVDKWAKPLPVECLRGKESVGNFGAHFQGSIKKIKRKEDYDALLHEHELVF